jgi:Spy/CpxP family protein refolding chaperone
MFFRNKGTFCVGALSNLVSADQGGKNMRKFTIAAVLIALTVFFTSTAQAAWWGGREKKHDPGKQIVQKLDLTAAQQEQFKSAREKLEKDNKPFFDKIKEGADSLRAEMEKDKPDLKAIEQSIRAINGWRAEIEVNRVRSLLALRASLSPDQRQKFHGLMRPLGFGRGQKK